MIATNADLQRANGPRGQVRQTGGGGGGAPWPPYGAGWRTIGGPGCHGTGSSPSGMGLRLDESSESDLCPNGDALTRADRGAAPAGTGNHSFYGKKNCMKCMNEME